MKAYQLHNINDLRYEDISEPDCPNGWVIVQVKAAGICSSDIPRIFTKGTYHFPTIPGHEFSGIVYKASQGVSEEWIGKPVGVFPLIPCRECEPCSKKHYEMCENYDYIGSRRDGGFAEYVAVPEWNLVELPGNVDFVSAAMLEPISVALHAIKQFGELKNRNLAIVGTGMIGICAGQWGKINKAREVTVLGRSELKRDIVESCGLKYMTHDRNEQKVLYDCVLEAVGTPSAVSMAINVTKPGGMIVLMGNPSGDICLSQNDYWRILRKQITLRGTWNSSYDGKNLSDWMEAIDVLGSGGLQVRKLVTHQYEQDILPKGLNLMLQHVEPYCKVMTLWNL